MKLAIIGTGYVGLVSGVCLAYKGHDVTCIDINPKIVESLNKCKPTIYEKGLEDLLIKVITEKRFRATTNLDTTLEDVDLVIIAVGTPSEKGAINLSSIKNVSKEIGLIIKRTNKKIAVIVKSTVLPSTTDSIVKSEIEKTSGKKFPFFGLGMNPEFLREGEAIADFLEPDRIVLGYEDTFTLDLLEKLYEPWSCEKLKVNTRTAELIKYTNNALLATQISTVNEIANLAAKIGDIDIIDVIKGVSLDKRWNPVINGERVNPTILNYLIPGCGFGGSCFPKDVQALRSQGENLGLKMDILNSVLKVNLTQPEKVVDILKQKLGFLANYKFLVLGLAFKPDTDDVRESASIGIINSLLKNDTHIMAHDPIAIENFKNYTGIESKKIYFVEDWKSVMRDVDIIIIATKWSEYLQIKDFNLKNKIVFDARRMFDENELIDVKEYLSIGKTKANVNLKL
jgi:UDPglucose 6-dehydrogenase